MIDRVIGNYRIVEKVGEGGMGAVYRALDLMLEREVAIKAIRPELSRDSEIVERFRAEAKMAARVAHPAIATIYSFFVEDDDLFLAMEFVHGKSLSQVLQEGGPLPWEQAVSLLDLALDGIEQAHRAGIVHRDLKPDNLMLTEAGRVKVMDFGIARAVGSGRLTRTGLLIGTLRYMAPEQIRGEEVDRRTDVYALGTVLYEMLTGRVPFDGTSDYAVLKAQVEETPTPPSRTVTGLPARLDQAILKALAKDPADRFQTVEEMRRFLLGQGEAAGPPTLAAVLPPGTASGLWSAAIAEQPTMVNTPTPPPGRQSAAPPASAAGTPGTGAGAAAAAGAGAASRSAPGTAGRGAAGAAGRSAPGTAGRSAAGAAGVAIATGTASAGAAASTGAAAPTGAASSGATGSVSAIGAARPAGKAAAATASRQSAASYREIQLIPAAGSPRRLAPWVAAALALALAAALLIPWLRRGPAGGPQPAAVAAGLGAGGANGAAGGPATAGAAANAGGAPATAGAAGAGVPGAGAAASGPAGTAGTTGAPGVGGTQAAGGTAATARAAAGAGATQKGAAADGGDAAGGTRTRAGARRRAGAETAATTDGAAPAAGAGTGDGGDDDVQATPADGEPAAGAAETTLARLRRLGNEITQECGDIRGIYASSLTNKERRGGHVSEDDTKLQDELKELHGAAEHFRDQFAPGFLARTRMRLGRFGHGEDENAQLKRLARELAASAARIEPLVATARPEPGVQVLWHHLDRLCKQVAALCGL